jgi:glycerol dehydrogenase-like iron-containing ADH family enzyme
VQVIPIVACPTNASHCTIVTGCVVKTGTVQLATSKQDQAQEGNPKYAIFHHDYPQYI